MEQLPQGFATDRTKDICHRLLEEAAENLQEASDKQRTPTDKNTDRKKQTNQKLKSPPT